MGTVRSAAGTRAVEGRERAPAVTVGMPVFNGERFVRGAIDSILAQTFEDFELLIVDNRSTDHTYEICLDYASRDPRVRCVRQRQNYGAIDNFNTTFRLSSGRYFKWAAADDLCAPDFLRRTVEVLERDPTVVLAYTSMPTIDEHGDRVEISYPGFDAEALELTASPDPAVRFTAMMHNFWYAEHLYGLMRADALARTRLHARHFISDHILLTELSLYGRFERIPAPLLRLRRHAGQTSKAPTARQRLNVVRATSRVPPALAIPWQYPMRLYLHASAVRRAPLDGATRARCWLGLARAVARWAGLRLRRAVG